MTNLFEKSIHLGLGLFTFSREKVEELVEELVSKGEVEKKDARQFASDLIKKGEEQKNEMKKVIKEEVVASLDYFDVAKKDDIVTKEEISQIVREQVLQVLREQGLTKGDDTK